MMREGTWETERLGSRGTCLSIDLHWDDADRCTPTVRTKWVLIGVMVHVPHWDYDKMWCMTPFVWSTWSLR